MFAFLFVHVYNMATVGLLREETKSELVNPQFVSQQLPTPVAMTFSGDEDIDHAFTRLSAAVTDIIQHTNFKHLQTACIEKARSPKMLHKSSQIIPVIKEAQSFEMLRFMLADTTYWNFLDIRMMEAMATASMIPAAQETIENYKKTFFSMTLKEAAPYFPVVPVKSGHTTMHEDLDKDPSQMTIGELHKHRFYLETEVIQTGPDTCTICSIKIGSVTIVWQIHLDNVYQAYISIKGKNSQLKSQAIRHLSIHQAIYFEARLPISLRGEIMEKNGPIQQCSESGESQPYPLPKGYEWVTLGYNDIDEICKMSDISKKHLQWIALHPNVQKTISLGIRDSLWKVLIHCIYCMPLNINIGGKMLPMVHIIQQTEQSLSHTPGLEYRLRIAGYKEAMRCLERVGIYQAYMTFSRETVFKPVVIVSHLVYDCEHSVLPYQSPKTIGLRRITSKDIPKALALTNQYSLQFEISQIFQSEEEFSHWFLCPSIPDYVTTYVVEDPVTGDITDMFSFRALSSTSQKLSVAQVTAVIVTKSPAKQLITDMLIIVKQQQFDTVGIFSDIVKRLQLDDLFLHTTFISYHVLYNYKYGEVDVENFCVFGHFF